MDNNCVNGGINCTPAQMAANDIFIWQQEAADLLPAGAVNVVFTDPGGGAPFDYQINVVWDEPGGGGPEGYTIQIPVFPL